MGYARYARRVVWGMLGILRRVVWGMLGILRGLFGVLGCAYESKMGDSIMNCKGRWCALYYPNQVY